MNVKIVDPSAYTPPYDHALCAALARVGVDVRLVTSRFLYGPVPDLEGFKRAESFYAISGRLFRRWPNSWLKLPLKLMEHPVDMQRLVRRVRRDGTDLVHFQWLTVQPLDIGFIRRISKPVVLTAHDILPREPRPGQIRSSRRLLQAVDAVIVHSEHGRMRLEDDLGIDRARVHVIPHGAFNYLTKTPDRAIDPALGDLGDCPVVLFFGLLRPYKGIDILIEAFARVRRDALLLIVGLPRMPVEPLARRAEELGLHERVRILPRFVTESEIPAYFRRADLVVLPYREIDQSGVFYTALAFGKPMVVSEVGGFTEMAERYGVALPVPPGNAEALSEAIDRLVGDTAARLRLASAAREAASGPFSWDTVAARTVELYRSLVGGSR